MRAPATEIQFWIQLFGSFLVDGHYGITQFTRPNQIDAFSASVGVLVMRGTEVEFKVGRRSVDGVVKLSSYQPQLLQLSVSYKGERASSVVLTRVQVQALRQALAECELAMDQEEGERAGWDQNERRVG